MLTFHPGNFLITNIHMSSEIHIWIWIIYKNECSFPGVTKRCRPSGQTNSASHMSPIAGRGRRLLWGLSQWVQLWTWIPNKVWISSSIFNLCYFHSCYLWLELTSSDIQRYAIRSLAYYTKRWRVGFTDENHCKVMLQQHSAYQGGGSCTGGAVTCT
jgi:hypothetical protein